MHTYLTIPNRIEKKQHVIVDGSSFIPRSLKININVINTFDPTNEHTRLES